MISAVDLSFATNNKAERRVLFHGLNAHIDAYERVGILAERGGGRTTLAKLFSGILKPDSGHVVARGKVSLPLGYGGGLHSELSVDQNISIISRASGSDADEAAALAIELGQLEHKRNLPVKDLTGSERRALAFCLSLANHSDVYIADDAMSFGDRTQQTMASEILMDRLDAAALIFLSHNPKQLSKMCDRFYILRSGALEPCSDLEGVRSLEDVGDTLAASESELVWYDE